MKLQKYFTIILSAVFVLFFSFWCFFIETPDFSESERRQLAQFPEFSLQSVSSGDFAKKFEEFTTDRFPARDMWRSVKAYSRLNVLLQKENNQLFVKDDHISKIEYPINTNMLDYAADLFTKIYQTHLKENPVYFCIVPDKNRYIADLKIDYDQLSDYIYGKLQFCTPIKIDNLLSADDYYFSDSHWRQDKIIDVADYISACMGADIKTEYEKTVLERNFYGVYAGQSALKCKADTITYLTSDIIKDFTVTGAKAVYDLEKANGRDAYELFLSGNQPVVKINNPHAYNQKRLIIFRDSFASSITPLLAQGYSEVIMIDLRYINSQLLDQFVDFSQADVLFMYSANLLNNSTSMK